ncbi:acyltransferase [bacterium]|nr:acyltransferase [bacterium]MBU1959341.1 acyltransferase [bacterium]
MLLSIQYLRAIAAFLVLLSHTAWKSIQIDNMTLAWWHDAGTFGVDIFFIISGFIMTHTSVKLYQQPHAIRTFLKKRFIRIVPLYWFFTLMALSAFLLFPQLVNSSGGKTEIFKSFFLLPLRANENYLVSVGWTLEFEFIFYFIFAIGLLFTQVRGNIFVFILLTFSFLGSIMLPELMMNHISHAFINNLFFEFALGMLLYYSIQNLKQISLLCSITLIVIGLVWFYATFSGYALMGVRAIDSGIPAFLFSFGLISLEYVWKKKESSLFLKLGDSSYALYLSHPFVLVIVFFLYRKLEKLLPQNEFLMNFSMIFVALVVGYVVHIFIEKKLIILAKFLFYSKY